MSLLPDLFKKQGALASLRPANIQQLSVHHANIDSASAAQQPQLLQRLETALNQGAQALASLPGGNSGGWGTAKLQLSTHRQVFEMFLASMTTYRPLLLRIKAEYDAALEDAIASAYDRANLQAQLAEVPHIHAEAVAAATQDAEVAAAAMQEELHNKLQDLEQQAEQAERQCKEAEEQLHHYQKHVLQARRELDQLEVSNRRTYKELLENSSWGLYSRVKQLGPI